MFDNYPAPGGGNNLGATGANPEDIFADLERQAGNRPPVRPVGQAPVPPASPIQPTPPPTAPNPVFSPVNRQVAGLPQMTDNGTGKSFKFLIIGLLTLVVILVGGFYLYQSVLLPKLTPQTLSEENPTLSENNPLENNTSQTATESLNETTVTPPPVVNETASTGLTAESTTSTVSTSAGAITTMTAATDTAPMAVLDTDKDGLTDDEELRLSTNYNAQDTDKDGLNDYEEYKTWQTDPLNADTDGDTYSDGQEIKAGYNPNGQGKLKNME